MVVFILPFILFGAALLTKQILDGRSTKGVKQTNDTGASWKQLWWINKN